MHWTSCCAEQQHQRHSHRRRLLSPRRRCSLRLLPSISRLVGIALPVPELAYVVVDEAREPAGRACGPDKPCEIGERAVHGVPPKGKLLDLLHRQRKRLEGELTTERQRAEKLNTALIAQRRATQAEQSANSRLRVALSSERKARASLKEANASLFESNTTLRGEVTLYRKEFAQLRKEHRAHAGMIGTMVKTVGGMNEQVGTINANQQMLDRQMMAFQVRLEGAEHVQADMVEYFDAHHDRRVEGIAGKACDDRLLDVMDGDSSSEDEKDLEPELDPNNYVNGVQSLGGHLRTKNNLRTAKVGSGGGS